MFSTNADARVTLSFHELQQFLQSVEKKASRHLPDGYTLYGTISGTKGLSFVLSKENPYKSCSLILRMTLADSGTVFIRGCLYGYFLGTHPLDVKGYSAILTENTTGLLKGSEGEPFRIRWPYTQRGIDITAQFIRNSIDACAIPVLEESAGTHENCSACDYQLCCISRSKEV